MSGARHYSEDGPEDTSAHPGGVPPSGHNGSFRPYVHPTHKGTLPAPAVAQRLQEIRLRLAVRAASRPV